MSTVDRRAFLQTTALAGAGLITATAANATDTQPTNIVKEVNKEKIRIAFLGVGLRGRGHALGRAGPPPPPEGPRHCSQSQNIGEVATPLQPQRPLFWGPRTAKTWKPRTSQVGYPNPADRS